MTKKDILFGHEHLLRNTLVFSTTRVASGFTCGVFWFCLSVFPHTGFFLTCFFPVCPGERCMHTVPARECPVLLPFNTQTHSCLRRGWVYYCAKHLHTSNLGPPPPQIQCFPSLKPSLLGTSSIPKITLETDAQKDKKCWDTLNFSTWENYFLGSYNTTWNCSMMDNREGECLAFWKIAGFPSVSMLWKLCSSYYCSYSYMTLVLGAILRWIL